MNSLCWKRLKQKAALSAVNHQTLAYCCPAVCRVTSYLRYLCKLSVCLAALVCSLHSNLIVIHKGPVHSELAGLQGADRTQVRLRDFSVFVTMHITITCQTQTECAYPSLKRSVLCRNESLIFYPNNHHWGNSYLLLSCLYSCPVCSVGKWSFLSGQETTPGSLLKASFQTRARSSHLLTASPLLLTTKRSRDGFKECYHYFLKVTDRINGVCWMKNQQIVWNLFGTLNWLFLATWGFELA